MQHSFVQIIESRFKPKTHASWEPAYTDSTLEYRFFFISNEHVIIWVQQNSPNLVADRVSTELLINITQTGSSLNSVKCKVDIKGRIIVKKSLGLIKSLVLSKTQKILETNTP
jgi:hypothetical protein